MNRHRLSCYAPEAHSETYDGPRRMWQPDITVYNGVTVRPKRRVTLQTMVTEALPFGMREGADRRAPKPD